MPGQLEVWFAKLGLVFKSEYAREQIQILLELRESLLLGSTHTVLPKLSHGQSTSTIFLFLHLQPGYTTSSILLLNVST